MTREICRHCRSWSKTASSALALDQCSACASTVHGVGLAPHLGTGSKVRPLLGLLPAEFWNQFTVERLLGEGAAAIVLLARQNSTGRRVAVKLLKRPGHQESRLQLQIEGDALSRLIHPRIVRLIDVHSGEYPHLVLEFVQGGTLQSLLEATGRLPVERAISLAVDCLLGLSFCHSQGFVHRDLKPRNILLTRTGRAKLADFGIVTSRSPGSEATLPDRKLGTPRYMAPEQVRGERAGPQSDLFSFGLILYEMLVGCGPFSPEEEWRTPVGNAPCERLSMDPLRRIAGRGLCDLIEQTLSPRSNDRPQDARRLAARLKSLLPAASGARRSITTSACDLSPSLNVAA
jgi:serine/threonine protein kinase